MLLLAVTHQQCGFTFPSVSGVGNSSATGKMFIINTIANVQVLK